MQFKDDQLVKEIISGSKTSLDTLVNRYYEVIYSYSMRQVNNQHLSADLTQEVFIKMMKNIDKYRLGTNSFKYWLLKIALNHIRDYFRAEKSTRDINIEDLDCLSDYDSDNILDILEKDEKRTSVKKALNSLKEEEREIVILKYYNEMTIKEIGSLIGAKESTIKSKLYRALEKLRKKLKGGDKDEEF